MHALLIGPVHSGLLYIGAAQEMGIKLSVITTDEGWYKLSDDLRAKVTEVITVESYDVDLLIHEAQTLHSQRPVGGVVAGSEYVVGQTAHIAKALGVAGFDPDKVDAVRNKATMRRTLQEAGVRTVKYAKASSAIDIEESAKRVGFPAVVKPLNLAGSVGVALVRNETELLAAYEDIVTMNIAEATKGQSKEQAVEVLMEEFLVGTEYCVDGWVEQDGTITVAEFVKVGLGPQPHFQEISYLSYRREDLACADELETYLKDVVRALGFTVGPFHSEVMQTNTGPVLIEIASRLPGDHLPELTETATGISFASCSLATHINYPVPRPKQPQARVAGSQFIIDHDAAGEVYTALAGWDDIVTRSEVDSAEYCVLPGTRIPPQHDFSSRIAEILFHADSVEAAEAFQKEIVEHVRIIQ